MSTQYDRYEGIFRWQGVSFVIEHDGTRLLFSAGGEPQELFWRTENLFYYDNIELTFVMDDAGNANELHIRDEDDDLVAVRIPGAKVVSESESNEIIDKLVKTTWGDDVSIIASEPLGGSTRSNVRRLTLTGAQCPASVIAKRDAAWSRNDQVGLFSDWAGLQLLGSVSPNCPWPSFISGDKENG